MAPHTGPNEAPIIVNTETTSPAQPVTASRILTAVPIPTEMNGLTFGSVVLKLLAAMNAEKQAGGMAAIARRYQKTAATLVPIIDSIKAVVCISPPAGDESASVGTRDDQQRQTSGEDRGAGDARRPPICTSLASRLFMPKSAPAAPAVAKKPMM